MWLPLLLMYFSAQGVLFAHERAPDMRQTAL